MTLREMWKATILVVGLAYLGLADSAQAINAWERWETELRSSDTLLTPLKAYRDVQIQGSSHPQAAPPSIVQSFPKAATTGIQRTGVTSTK